MPMAERKKIGLIRYLGYLVLVTSVVASVSLAKYTAQAQLGASAQVAAFTTDTILSLDMPVVDMLYPGASKEFSFRVTNFQGDRVTEVPLTYEIQVETTGNLPLQFSLAGTEPGGTGESLVGALDAELHAVGGEFPSLAQDAKGKTHFYVLTVRWPTEKASPNDPDPTDPAFSDEIDQVTVKVKSTQAVPQIPAS